MNPIAGVLFAWCIVAVYLAIAISQFPVTP